MLFRSGGASKIGVLIKGSNYLEQLANTEIVVFDKTGTLTKGIFEVQKIETKDFKKDELLKFAAYAESYSNHPISISLKKAYGKEIDQKIISNSEEISGHGVRSVVGGKEVLVGNDKLMKQNNIDYTICNDVGTILYVAVDGKFAGYILIADEIKEDAKEIIRKLKANNIQKIVMLTGEIGRASCSERV